MEAMVARAIERALGERPRGVTHIPTEGDSIVCAVRLEGRDVIFKANLAPDLRVERWISQQLIARGVPVPRVLAFEPVPPDFPLGFAVVERAPGQPLASMDPSQSIDPPVAAGVGRLMRIVHATEVDGVGWLGVSETGEARGRSADWLDMLSQEAAWGLPYVLKHRLLDEESVERGMRALRDRAGLLRAMRDSSLLHGDFRPDHVFAENGRVTAILDFQGRVGDPVYDIAKWSFLTDAAGTEAFLSGYGPDARIRDGIAERGDLYVFLVASGVLRWVHEKRYSDPTLIPRLRALVVERARRL